MIFVFFSDGTFNTCGSCVITILRHRWAHGFELLGFLRLVLKPNNNNNNKRNGLSPWEFCLWAEPPTDEPTIAWKKSLHVQPHTKFIPKKYEFQGERVPFLHKATPENLKIWFKKCVVRNLGLNFRYPCNQLAIGCRQAASSSICCACFCLNRQDPRNWLLSQKSHVATGWNGTCFDVPLFWLTTQ